MREFLNCDINSGMPHYEEILQEAESRHPGFRASLKYDDVLIHALELKATSCCTLKCRDCTHLIPYTDHPRHIEVETIIENLRRILAVSKIGGLILLGGEIFIYPYIKELIEGYKKLNMVDRVGFVRVTTNGTVVPSDEFCEAFKDVKNSYVFISDYGDLSIKKQEIVDKLGKYGIRVELGEPDMEWKTLGGIERRDYSEEEVKRLYKVCHGKIYLHLYGDHLYHCYRAPLLNDDGLAPHVDTDYLDMKKTAPEEFKKHLVEYINDLPYMESCYYCDGFHTCSLPVPRAVQL